MSDKISFLIFRTAARIFGSLLFPLFEGWGESELKPRKCKVVFARNFGLVGLLNAFRFFTSPFSLVVRVSEAKSRIWKLLGLGGIRIYELDDQADYEQSFALINRIVENGEVPLYLLSDTKLTEEDSLIRNFADSEILFFAVSGCKNNWSLKFIPVVRDMKAFCVSLPVYGENKEKFSGLKSLEFLEKALEVTPQFETPSFFCTHQRYSAFNQ